MNEYLIRPARPEEVYLMPALAQEAAQRFRESPYPELAEEPGYDVDQYREWLQQGAIWVVETSKGLVGFAVAHEMDGQGFLEEMDVMVEHGRRGVGRRLVEVARTWGALRGYTELRLSTFINVPWNAPFYRQLGFRVLGEAEWGLELLELRRQEAEAGLDVANRVMMTIRCR